MGILKYINTGDLCIAYEESGNPNRTPVILLHGFPYDVRTYDEVAKNLLTGNYWIIVRTYVGSDQQAFYLLRLPVLANRQHWPATWLH
jgi:pimeloyl-ACP methyl ester carboxylesterase